MTLSTPIGSCGCGKSICNCFGRDDVPTEEKSIEDDVAKRIKVALRVEMQSVEALMQMAMIKSLRQFGTLPPIQILQPGVASPPAASRMLTVRVNSRQPEGFDNAEAID